MGDKLKVLVVALALVLPIAYFYSIDTQKVIQENTVSLSESSKVATFVTSKGSFTVELRGDIAPKAVENFVSLVKTGYYRGIVFHRVVENTLIQSGDPTNTGTGGESIWGKPFEDEFSTNVLFDKGYLLAMANSGKNTNRSQFFITTKPLMELNGLHTIFGRVLNGHEVVLAIASTANGDEKVVIEKIVLN